MHSWLLLEHVHAIPVISLLSSSPGAQKFSTAITSLYICNKPVLHHQAGTDTVSGIYHSRLFWYPHFLAVAHTTECGAGETELDRYCAVRGRMERFHIIIMWPLDIPSYWLRVLSALQTDLEDKRTWHENLLGSANLQLCETQRKQKWDGFNTT